MDHQADADNSTILPPYLWMEPWDWSVPDPLAETAATPTYAHLPQAAEIPPELPQIPWDSQAPRDQEIVGLPGLRRWSSITDFCF